MIKKNNIWKKLNLSLITLAFISSNILPTIGSLEDGQEALSDLIDDQSELSEASKASRGITKKISSSLKKIQSTLKSSESSCNKRLLPTVSSCSRSISLLEKKGCVEGFRKNCIEENVLDQFLPELQEAIQRLKDIFSMDDDENGVLDVCEDDPDNDGIERAKDNCPLVSNPLQKDTNNNRIGDLCDLFTCCDSFGAGPSRGSCDKDTIKGCRGEGRTIVDCIKPIKKGGKSIISASGSTTSFPVIRRFFDSSVEPTPSMITLFQTGGTEGSGDAMDGTTDAGDMSGDDTMTGEEAADEFADRLQEAINMSTVPSMEYGEDYDCDDFAGDLEGELEGQGFMSTFTATWTDDGSETVPGHALTDVHGPGGVVWVEPQTGEIVDLDEDGDGEIMASDGTHSDEFMAGEGMSQIEVYPDRDAASMAGVPID